MEPQAGVDPAVLEAKFLLLQEASGFALSGLTDWTRGHHSIEGDLLYFSSKDDVNHIH